MFIIQGTHAPASTNYASISIIRFIDHLAILANTTASSPAPGPTQSIQRVSPTVPTGIKRPGPEADHPLRNAVTRLRILSTTISFPCMASRGSI